jgi:hypothetical protein
MRKGAGIYFFANFLLFAGKNQYPSFFLPLPHQPQVFLVSTLHDVVR